ncbi:MAG: hypothetical protein OEZ06_20975 [Myxococcales bacterium]|nr:hypothetical protein [Myxococcales bacterium]
MTAAVAIWCIGASSASAQRWLADRERAEGHGIRLGDFELHPGVGAEVGWDSNVFLGEDGDDPNSAVLRVAPHLYLSNLTKERLQGEVQRTEFRFGVSGRLRHYFATDARTDVGVAQNLSLKHRAGRLVALELFETFSREIEPFADAGAPAASSSFNPPGFGRDKLEVGGRFELHSSGELLRGGLGYAYGFDIFEDGAFDGNSSDRHRFLADTSWQFLPKTSLIWRGNLIFHDWEATPANLATERNGSTQIHNLLGLNGALTPSFGFTLLGGYSAGFYDDEGDFEGVSAEAQSRWRIQDNFSWNLKLAREYRSAFQGNYARFDRIGTEFQLLFGGAWVITPSLQVAFVDYGVDDRADQFNGGPREDIHWRANLSGEYRVVDWFAITGEFGYLRNDTDFVYVIDVANTAGGTMQVSDAAEYTRYELWFGVRAFL